MIETGPTPNCPMLEGTAHRTSFWSWKMVVLIALIVIVGIIAITAVAMNVEGSEVAKGRFGRALPADTTPSSMSPTMTKPDFLRVPPPTTTKPDFLRVPPPTTTMPSEIEKATLANDECDNGMSCMVYLDKCKINDNYNHTRLIKTLTSWLGRGYDALQERPKMMAMELAFSKCRTSADGSELIPDGADLITLGRTSIEATYQAIDTYEKLVTTQRIDVEMGVDVPIYEFIGLSGSFNGDLLDMKLKMAKKNTQISVKLMKVEKRKLSMELDEYDINPAFKIRLEKIFKFYGEKKLNHVEYYCQELINLYGQGFITSIVLGARLEDYKLSSLRNSENESRFEIGAGYDVSANVLGAGAHSRGEGSIDTDRQSGRKEANIKYKRKMIGAFADPKIVENKENMKVEEEGPLKIRIKPLSKLLTSKNFPNCNPDSLKDIGKELDKASTEMFERNMHKGCTDTKSFSYDYQANMNDPALCIHIENVPFGGFYMKVQNISVLNCSDPNAADSLRVLASRLLEVDRTSSKLYQTNNPLTNELFCANHYMEVRIRREHDLVRITLRKVGL
ncbi:hypothetical protein WR25_09881 isoform H [Diploscapter pachys]|uniref:MACPF domain-containing protein n=1 Tax=Diploscapter pachys TaxID=2018661 RepID=A0A2A2JC53_9BILA|nr:hypothetical protein WR25_09881 isoform F [Diploscapter pachys]PAV59227.1 hypothetical protein WR25_09881 isoform H [Diploscapter pachys]